MLEPNKIFKLNKSSLILIEGNDKFDFIQGIISNDIKFLKKEIYLCSNAFTTRKISL